MTVKILPYLQENDSNICAARQTAVKIVYDSTLRTLLRKPELRLNIYKEILRMSLWILGPSVHRMNLILGSLEFKSSVTLWKTVNWSASLLVGIFNHVTSIWNICFLNLFQRHACKLTKLSACMAKCMTTINKIYILLWKHIKCFPYILRRKNHWSVRINICVQRKLGQEITWSSYDRTVVV